MDTRTRPARQDDLADNVIQFEACAIAGRTATNAASRKTFTSEKLTWMEYLRKDHGLELSARIVGITIAQHINEKSRTTYISDRLIADEIGISVRSVVTARQALRDGQWIAWCKPTPRGPNHTKLVTAQKNIDAIDDHQTALRDRRDFEAIRREAGGLKS